MQSNRNLFRFILLLCCLSAETAAQTHNYLEIKKLDGGKITYEKYKGDGPYMIDISDLTLWDKAQGAEEIFNTFYSDSTNLRVLLLQLGYAKLNDPNKANEQEVAAQDEARSAGRGMWKQSAPTPKSTPVPTSDTQLKEINWSEIWRYTWQVFFILASLGIVSAIGKYIYKNFYLLRRVKLLIIGEPSSGKTALLLTLVDPHISKADLLNTKVSRGILQKKGLVHIPRGKFEIIPDITDVAGRAFGIVWDTMIENYNHALVIVLCPSTKNGVAPDGSRQLLNISTDIDQKYIDMQIAYVQAFVEGGLTAKRTKKPRIVLLFISKFDLFSIASPDDSASQQVKRKLHDLFKEHINSAESAAKKANIPFELVIGSAVEKWNTEQILGAVARALYKA